MLALKVFAGVLAAAIVAFLAVGAARPHRWHVEKTLVMAAPPEAVFAHVGHLEAWPAWMPLEDEGCALEDTRIACPHSKVKIKDADPARGVWLDEEIGDDEATASFTFEKLGPASTKVTWVGDGALMPVVGGWMHGTVEEQIGARMDTSLGRLQRIVAGEARTTTP